MPRIFVPFILLLTMSLPFSAYGAEKATHLDGTKVPRGCATCHNGFNFKTGGGAAICIVCHGDPSRISQEYKFMPKKFAPKVSEHKNIEAEFNKPFHHPAFELSAGLHRPGEAFPETDTRAPRHASCSDCHNIHYSSPSSKYAGLKNKRELAKSITKEYELCYRCHGDSANLPARSTNKRALFASTNPSFHPVEAEGRNSAVVSLLKPYKEKKVAPGEVSRVSCSDCHGSDDSSSPSGPHGSNNEFILTDFYSIRDNQSESPQNYALCYRCHSRTSIMGDESFKYHSLHINGRAQGSSFSGTSCHTCHDSHGSTEYKYLIRFNKEVVSANANGVLKFVEKGVASFRGECYLSCHGVDHNPKKY